ncbi:MAG: polymerase IV protein [Parcubacteria group bacterium GW2011_GWA2_43_17]|nr:MAG: polymerase IV protein [Parcubacteria group bacterium GW2011_GWA2_43_17]KKT91980.1 MAG: polymerase IV protein [Parcubacteria group bacterium GW2011_GWF2_45_11]KKT96579.1 MAG: polymerase IV protein [Parcubacteria group bacterium GW2011_GWC2_45_15]HAH04874.1 hypothetical protein [Candidatus Komeilibacteria bacterium]HBR13875.1 hypothetical protein [Candidatus Komeilibacteria bacterium]
MQRIILHLDMNSYFASVEQQANPFFRNKPLGVCAYLSPNGCIIASSVEAKKVGVKTGCRVYQAVKLCPQVILVENDPNKYRSVTQKLFGIMKSYSDSFEPYSIDEAFLDLTGWCRDFKQAEYLAEKIRGRVKAEIGSWLRCSIGLSFTKFLAKFASDTAGVDSTLMLPDQASLEPVFRGRQLTDLWGVNRRFKKHLNALGIRTIADLRVFPVQNLFSALGKPGYWLYCHVNGLEIDHLRSLEELKSKSIGHSYCLPRWTVDKKYLSAVLFKLASKVGVRLRERKQLAYGVYVHWSYIGQGGLSKSFKLKKPVYTTDDIFRPAQQVLSRAELSHKVTMLAIGVFNLCPMFKQPELFFRPDLNLSEAMDQINGRYGSQMIYRGLLWKTENLAKDRIGFRKIDF